MINFSMTIEDIQHIKKLEFSIDLSSSGIYAIIGKNGVGKTMLFKAIQNLVTSNTFAKTSNKYIYKDSSKIIYNIDGAVYTYEYNEDVGTLDSKEVVTDEMQNNIYVELPIPFGERFKYFQRLGEVDSEIRSRIGTKRYTSPCELIELLNYVYDSNRFDNFVEIEIRKEKYYAIPLENNYYIREDYLSSAEYFIISIYKMIQKKCKFIAIDEIDISLDAMAQVRFIEKLRELSSKYNTKILFSTHSLALIKTLDKKKDDKLYYMELKEGIVSFEEKSYNYIKSLLYGFQDYDKYILTEDETLKDYMEYLLKDENIFSKYIILYIGGASNTVSLMEMNKTKKVFEHSNNVITVLDGDVKIEFMENDNVYFLPFDSVEKELFTYYQCEDVGFINFSEDELGRYNVSSVPKAKEIYKMILREKLKTKHDVFRFISEKKHDLVNEFKIVLCNFLTVSEAG